VQSRLAPSAATALVPRARLWSHPPIAARMLEHPLFHYATPSSSAAPSGVQRAVSMTVTKHKTGSTPLSPYTWYEDVAVNRVAADQIFDSAKGVSGGPTTGLLPGRSATYVIAFAVPPTGGEFILQTRFSYKDSVHYLARV
jgi:hypothetical protein